MSRGFPPHSIRVRRRQENLLEQEAVITRLCGSVHEEYAQAFATCGNTSPRRAYLDGDPLATHAPNGPVAKRYGNAARLSRRELETRTLCERMFQVISNPYGRCYLLDGTLPKINPWLDIKTLSTRAPHGHEFSTRSPRFSGQTSGRSENREGSVSPLRLRLVSEAEAL
jgi:hypothetical protein